MCTHIVHFLGIQLVPMFSTSASRGLLPNPGHLCVLPGCQEGLLCIRQKFTETRSMLFKPHALKQDGVSFPASPGKNKTKELVLSLAPCASSLVPLGSTLRSQRLMSVRGRLSEVDLDVQIRFFIHSGTLSCPLTGPCFSVHIYI